MKAELRLGHGVLLTVLLIHCGGPDAPSSDAGDLPTDLLTSPDSPPPPQRTPPLTTDCRPVDHVWDPAKEPKLLPCEPTTEPCDNIDNDADGFTDPHCGSMPCLSDADCTYGGMLPDADCNPHPTPSILLGDLPGGVCNQIDGVPGDKTLEFCWGMLCPPTLKCVQGDCIPPGKGLPGAECSSGADCPLNAGCIPVEAMTIGPSIGRCKWYCHEFSCPEGIVCQNGQETLPGTGELFETWVCDDGIPDCTDKAYSDDGCGGLCHENCEGACMNGDDFIKVDVLMNSAVQCGKSSGADPTATSTCLTESTGISMGCATCYGELISCMFNNCAPPVCEGQETPACNACLTANCTTAFKACSGLDLFEKDASPKGGS